MPIINEKITGLTPEGAVHILGQFLPQLWENINPKNVTVTRITEGYLNTLNIIQVKGKDETRVIIRHKGGNECLDILSVVGGPDICPMDEVLVNHSLGEKKIGPKLFGVFNGGSVMEYIPSHSLTYDELKDETIFSDLAKLFARIHAVDLPLKKVVSFNYKTNTIDDSNLLDLKPHLSSERYTKLSHTQWDKEERWIDSFIKLNHVSIKFCHYDPNAANILVRDTVNLGQLKVVLVDYELSRYSYRTCDIARLFILSRMNVKTKGNAFLQGVDFSGEDVSRFLKVYLDEYLKVTPDDQVDPSKDNIHFLEREMDIGMLIQGWELMKMFVSKFHSFQDHNFASFASYNLDIYLKHKKKLIQNYPEHFKG